MKRLILIQSVKGMKKGLHLWDIFLFIEQIKFEYESAIIAEDIII